MRKSLLILMKISIFAYIYCAQYLNNYEYGNKNTANTRVQPQYDSIIW